MNLKLGLPGPIAIGKYVLHQRTRRVVLGADRISVLDACFGLRFRLGKPLLTYLAYREIIWRAARRFRVWNTPPTRLANSAPVRVGLIISVWSVLRSRQQSYIVRTSVAS